MSEVWENVNTVCCKPWLVLPTVYSDALSYGEQLDKFCYSLNKVIENNNILPYYVAEKIREYISGGAIGEVVRDILADYILNVKYPPEGITPAVGDGSADDTSALQGCIDYVAENGGVVYFPYGSYLTQPLTMKSGVSLFGFDRYSTKIVLKGGATKALLNGNGNNLSVCYLTLDGNSGIQVNDVNVVDMTGSDLLFNNLIIKDGYKLFNFVGDGHLQLDNIVFGSAVENCFSVDGNVIVEAKNLLFSELSKVGGISVVNIKSNGGNYDFISVAKCDTCMVISGNDNKVIAMIGGANNDYVDSGEHNNVEIVGHSKKEYFSGNVKKDANNSETTLQGTRSLHVVGANTFAVDGNSTESVDGNKSEIVTGTTSETYKDTKTINLTNEDKTLTGKKTTSANSIAETVTGEKTVNANSIAETVTGEKTVNANSIAETVTGEKTVNANSVEETIARDYTLNAENITETCGNRTIKVTGKREVNIDGTDNLFVKGLRTETFKNGKKETVTGAYEGTFGSVTLQTDGTYIGNFKAASFQTGATSWAVQFPNKTVDLAWIAMSPATNVKECGAIGDGTADDTEAFKKAAAIGGLIIVPQGKYRIKQTISLKSNTILTGCGGSVILIDGASPVMQVWSSGKIDRENCNVRITNLEITLHPDASSGSGISVGQDYEENVTTKRGTTDIYLDHLYIHDIDDRGINTYAGRELTKRKHGYPEIYIDNCILYRCKGSIINSSVTVNITRCTIKDNKSGGGEAISIDNGCIYSRISDCMLENNSGGAGVISMDETEFLIVEGCNIIDGSVTKIKLNLLSGNCDSVIIRDNYMIGSSNAIECTTSSKYTANSMQVYNNRSISPLAPNGMRGDVFTGNNWGNTLTDSEVIYLFNNFAVTDLTRTLNNPFTFTNGFSDPGSRSKIFIKNGVITQVLLVCTKSSALAENDKPCTCEINIPNDMEFCSPYITYSQAEDKTITAVYNKLEIISRTNSFNIFGVTNFPSTSIDVAF